VGIDIDMVMDMDMDKGRGMDFEGTEGLAEVLLVEGGGVVAGLPFLPFPFGVLCSSLLCSSPPVPCPLLHSLLLVSSFCSARG